MTSGVVIEINRELLAGTSEPRALIRPDLLESACQRPYNHWRFEDLDDVVSLATILLFAIAANHPFLQGNKRTAFAAMTLFLEDNGYHLGLADDERCADDIVSVLDGTLPQATFEGRLREVVVPAV